MYYPGSVGGITSQPCNSCAAQPSFGTLGATTYPSFGSSSFASPYPGAIYNGSRRLGTYPSSMAGGYAGSAISSPIYAPATLPTVRPNYLPGYSAYQAFPRFPAASSFTTASPFTAPLPAYTSNYVPPVTSFAPATTLPFASSPYTSTLGTASYLPSTSYLPSPLPASATYGSYAAASPVTFAARSYGNYVPYTPASGFFPAAPSYTPFSAYGGYRGLEQPLDMPILALPAPPTFVGSSNISLPAPNVLPFASTSTLPLASGSIFPFSSGSVLPSSTFFPSPVTGSSFLPGFPLTSGSFFPTTLPTFDNFVSAPADAPTEVAEGEEAAAAEEAEREPEEEVVHTEAVVPEQKAPWAASQGEEDFDLEYSRQVAARKVVGEEQ